MQNQAFENEVLRLTNEFRKQNGLKALVLDTNLDETAELDAVEILDEVVENSVDDKSATKDSGEDKMEMMEDDAMKKEPEEEEKKVVIS